MDIPRISLFFSHICLSLHSFILQTALLYEVWGRNDVSFRRSSLQHLFSCAQGGLHLALLQSHSWASAVARELRTYAWSIPDPPVVVGWCYQLKWHGMRDWGFPRNGLLDFPYNICPTYFLKWLLCRIYLFFTGLLIKHSGAVKLGFYSAYLKLMCELIRYFRELKYVQIMWEL